MPVTIALATVWRVSQSKMSLKPKPSRRPAASSRSRNGPAGSRRSPRNTRRMSGTPSTAAAASTKPAAPRTASFSRLGNSAKNPRRTTRQDNRRHHQQQVVPHLVAKVRPTAHEWLAVWRRGMAGGLGVIRLPPDEQERHDVRREQQQLGQRGQARRLAIVLDDRPPAQAEQDTEIARRQQQRLPVGGRRI